MNRTELQRLAEERIDDARGLIGIGRWSAAYYLAGYAVEFALKSCILARIERTGILFRDREYLRKLGQCWTHDFDELIGLAGLMAEFGLARGANSALKNRWETAVLWKETSRYDQKSRTDAEKLVDAIAHEPDGVLRWLRTYW